MASRPGMLAPNAVYPIPDLRPGGPLVRAVGALRRRSRGALARLHAWWLAAEGREVALLASRLYAETAEQRATRLPGLRGRLRASLDDSVAQRESLALAGVALALGEPAAPGTAARINALPTAGECAAALAVMRGMLAELGGAPDPERVATLAALALAPWGGGVHLVCRDEEQVAAMLPRLESAAGSLGLAVGSLQAGSGPAEHRSAWAADLSCVTPGELVTDALRDVRQLADRPGDLRLRLERLHGVTPRATELLQRGLRCAVLVDAERLLLDDAMRSVALSADESASQELQALALAWDVAGFFESGSGLMRVRVDESSAATWHECVELTEAGRGRLAEMLDQRGGPWSAPLWREYRVTLALLARHVLLPEVHYQLASEGPRIEPVEPAFSALIPERDEQRIVLDLLAIGHEREVPRSGTPVASMSLMECFLRYPRLGGSLSGADRLMRRELRDLYGLVVLPLAEALPPPPDPERFVPTPEQRAALIQARAEHRRVAARLQKLLSFSSG